MTPQLQARRPQPQYLKAASTVAQARVDSSDEASHELPTKSRPRARWQSSKPRQDAGSVDVNSKQATIALVCRILAPEHSHRLDTSNPPSIAEILPPLTSSNDVDLQLYAFVAIIVKDFVNSWYSSITTDHTFVDEVIKIVAHCSQALEQRMRKVDMIALALDEIPALLKDHVEVFRVTEAAAFQQPYAASLEHAYHALNPHPALNLERSQYRGSSPTTTQQEDEAAYRQLLVMGTLAVLLPTDELQNAPLRIFVSDVLADLIIGQALVGNLAEGWFIHQTMTKIVTMINEMKSPNPSKSGTRKGTQTRLERFGLLNAQSASKANQRAAGRQSSISHWIWNIVQNLYLFFTFCKFIAKGISRARRSRGGRFGQQANVIADATDSAVNPQKHPASTRPTIAFSIVPAMLALVRLEARMPWLAGAILFWRHFLEYGFGRVAAADAILDRFLRSAIETYVLPPSMIALTLQNARVALFPNNSLGPAAPPAPSADEQIEIRRTSASAILSLFPSVVSHKLYNTRDDEDIVRQLEADMLAPFSNKYLNKHLIYSVLELVLVRLVPELADASIAELLAEKGIVLGRAEDPDFI